MLLSTTTVTPVLPLLPFSPTHRGPQQRWGNYPFSGGNHTRHPLAMPMYAVLHFLIKRLPESVKQVWYANDTTAPGSVTGLRAWWDILARLWRNYGYFPNPSKTWLVSKEACYSEANVAFEHQCQCIFVLGDHIISMPLWALQLTLTSSYEKVEQWSSLLRQPPHSHSICSLQPWVLQQIVVYLSHTTMLATPPPPPPRDLFALPARQGGLGFRNKVKNSDLEFSASRQICD